MTSRIARLPRAVVLPLLASLLALSAGGCRSRCASDADCVKSCPCTEKGGDQDSRDTSQLCSVQLRCQDTFCEAEEGMICGAPGDDFCSKYASRGLCGSKKCDNNDDCVKTCTCATQVRFSDNGTQQVEDCCFRLKVHGTCDDKAGACDTAYSRSCDDICQTVQVPSETTCTQLCNGLNPAGMTPVCSTKSCKAATGFPVPGQ